MSSRNSSKEQLPLFKSASVAVIVIIVELNTTDPTGGDCVRVMLGSQASAAVAIVV